MVPPELLTQEPKHPNNSRQKEFPWPKKCSPKIVIIIKYKPF